MRSIPIWSGPKELKMASPFSIHKLICVKQEECTLLSLKRSLEDVDVPSELSKNCQRTLYVFYPCICIV